MYNTKQESMLTKNNKVLKDYHYLHFLYEATHQKPVCASPPLEICIEASSFCNARCIHCSSWRSKRKRNFMTLDMFKQIIDQVKIFKPYIAYHLQGEPTLNKDLDKMIGYVKEAQLEDRLVTNGVLLTREKIKKFIKAGLDQVVFSVSAASAQGYKNIYRIDKLEVVLRNLIDFIEERHNTRREIRIRTVFVETPETIHEKNKYLKMFSLIPVDHPSVSPMFNFYGDNTSARVDTKMLRAKDLPVCKIPWKYFSVTAEGKVRACIFDVYDRYILGNIEQMDLNQFWNCQRMQEFRQSLLKRRFDLNEKDGDLCSKCNQMFMNVKKDQTCTSQWPHNFEEEAAKYFAAGSSHLFETMTLSEYNRKFKYLSENKEDWIELVLRNDTSPTKKKA